MVEWLVPCMLRSGERLGPGGMIGIAGEDF